MAMEEVESFGSSMSSAFEDLEPFALEGTRSSFFLGTDSSSTDGTGGAGDTFLSSLLQEKKKKLSLRNVAKSVMALQHRSFRKSSVVSPKPTENNAAQELPPPKLQNTRRASEVVFLEESSDLSRAQRLAVEVNHWLEEPAGESVNRVRLMKSVLADEDTATLFLARKDEEALDEAIGTGLAYEMLEKIDDFRSQQNADTKISQAFDVLIAAAMSCVDFPTPLPEELTHALHICLHEWRPPLSSFFALKFIITLSPSEAMPYCKHVLTDCSQFNFRVTETALVCVAEESLEGTLSSPNSWVSPVLAVFRLLAATKISSEMITLALDIMSFTFTCGGSTTFLDQKGYDVFAEILKIAMPEELHADVVRRIIKLLSPTHLEAMTEDLAASAEDPLKQEGQELQSYGFPMSPRVEESSSPLESRSMFGFGDQLDGSASMNSPKSPKRNRLRDETLISLIKCLTLAATKFVHSENDAAVLEECCIGAYGYLNVSSTICQKEEVVSQLCEVFVDTETLWARESTVRGLLSVIQQYVVVCNRKKKNVDTDTVEDNVLGVVAQAQEETTTSTNVAYYRCIMDDAAILSTFSLSVRCFRTFSPTKCAPLAAVLKALYMMAHAEPARSHLLGSRLPNRQPAQHLLIPVLQYVVFDQEASAMHRYSFSILHRLCKGAHRAACRNLLMMEHTSGKSTKTFLEHLGNKIVVESKQLVHSMVMVAAELARYCIQADCPVSIEALQQFFSAITTSMQNSLSEAFIVNYGCMILGHLCRYKTNGASDATNNDTEIVSYALQAGALDLALQLSRDPLHSEAIGYLLAALSVHSTACVSILEEDAVDAIEKASTFVGETQSPSKGGKGDVVKVLTRQDITFCRQRLMHVKNYRAHGSPLLDSPSTSQLAPTFSSGQLLQPPAASRQRRSSNDQMAALEIQKANLLSEFMDTYHACDAHEQELRVSIEKQANDAKRQLATIERRRVEEHRDQRRHAETHEAQERGMIEKFAEEDFMNIVSYSQKSLHKKMTVLQRRVTSLHNSPSTRQLGFDDVAFGSRRESIFETASSANEEQSLNRHPDTPPREAAPTTPLDGPLVTIVAPGEDLQVSRLQAEAKRASHHSRASRSSGVDTAVLQSMMEMMSSLQQTVADMQRQQKTQMEQLIQHTERIMTPTPPPSTRPATTSEEPPLYIPSRPTSAQLYYRQPSPPNAASYPSPPPYIDDHDLTAVERRTRLLCRRPLSAGTRFGRASQNEVSRVRPGRASYDSRKPTGYLVPNAKVEELIAYVDMQAESLSELNLEKNYLGDKGVLELLPSLQKCKRLRHLCLRQNGFSAYCIPQLLEALEDTQLESLDLSFNGSVTPRAGRYIVSFTKSHESVMTVNVEGTQIFASTKAILVEVLAQRQLKNVINTRTNRESFPSE